MLPDAATYGDRNKLPSYPLLVLRSRDESTVGRRECSRFVLQPATLIASELSLRAV